MAGRCRRRKSQPALRLPRRPAALGMAGTGVDFLALLLLADLQGTRAQTTFEAQQVQPSTTAAALSRLFGESTSTGMSLQLHSGPGVADTETPQRDGGPEARPRPRSLRQAWKEKERAHVPSLDEDASFGEEEGEGEGSRFLDIVDNVGGVGTYLWRRRGMASRIRADGVAGAIADADAGAIAEAALIRRGDFASLRGRCNDGDSFTVTSAALPVADGCYSAVVGTNFGEGPSYSTDEDDKRLLYPKLISRDGESKYFWAAAAFGGFSGGTSPIDCLSVEPTSTYLHPAAATWQCDADGSGSLERITDEGFFAVCGCGTTATSGSSSSVFSPAPSGTPASISSRGELLTATPTAALTVPTGDPGTLTTPAPTTIPTPAASTSPPSSASPPVTERQISGCGRRIAGIRAGSLAALTLGAGVCSSLVTVFGASLL